MKFISTPRVHLQIELSTE